MPSSREVGPLEEFRRHSLWCPGGRPPGVWRLDVGVDTGAFPVWGWGRYVPGPGKPAEGTGNVRPDALGISAELTADLQAWANWHDQHQDVPWRAPGGTALPSTDERWQHWRDDGYALAERLEGESGAAVVYPARSRDPACPTCRPRS